MAHTSEARLELYRQSWSSGSEAVMSHWDDSLEFSDYNTGHLHMNKDDAKQFLAFMYSVCGDVELTTRLLHIAGERHTWETDMEFTMLQDVPDSPYKKGERAQMRGVSLLEWTADGRVSKQSDYYCWVQPDGND